MAMLIGYVRVSKSDGTQGAIPLNRGPRPVAVRSALLPGSRAPVDFLPHRRSAASPQA